MSAPEPITKKELRRLETAYQTAARRADIARGARNAGVLDALAAGMTHQWISEATGLSRGRISQLAPNVDTSHIPPYIPGGARSCNPSRPPSMPQ